MPRCERCEESESIIECHDCEKAGPIKLCAECSEIIHCKGKGAKHVLYSLDMQEKRTHAKKRCDEIKVVSAQLNIRKQETQEYRKQLHEAVAVSERNVRKTITEVQRKLKLKAKDLMDQIKAEVSRRDQVLQEAVEHWDELKDMLRQDETHIKSLLQEDDTQFSKDIEAVMEETNRPVEVHMLPSMELVFKLDYTGIMAAINTLAISFPPNDTDVLEESIVPFDPVDEGLETHCYVASIMNRDGSFWLLPEISEETYLNLLHISNRVRKMYIDNVNLRTLGETGEEPVAGSLVFCRHKADRKWYRGRIEEVTGMPGSALVRWLDYGKADRVALHDILPAPEDMFRDIRPWAIEATLLNELGPSIPQEIRWMFGDWTKEHELRCTINHQVECQNGRIVYQVTLERPEENGGVTNINKLVAAKVESSSSSKSTLASRDIRLDMDPTIQRTTHILNSSQPDSKAAEGQTDTEVRSENASDAKPIDFKEVPTNHEFKPDSEIVCADKSREKDSSEHLSTEMLNIENSENVCVQNGIDSQTAEQLDSAKQGEICSDKTKGEVTAPDRDGVINGKLDEQSSSLPPAEADSVTGDDAASTAGHEMNTVLNTDISASEELVQNSASEKANFCPSHTSSLPGSSCSPNSHLVEAFQKDEMDSLHNVKGSDMSENVETGVDQGKTEPSVEGGPAELYTSLGSESDDVYSDGGMDVDNNSLPYTRMPTIEVNSSNSSPENSYKDSMDVNLQTQLSEISKQGNESDITCKTDTAENLVTNQASNEASVQMESEDSVISSECAQNHSDAGVDVVIASEQQAEQLLPEQVSATREDDENSQNATCDVTNLAGEPRSSWISNVPSADKEAPSDSPGETVFSNVSEHNNDGEVIRDKFLEKVAAQIVSETVSQSAGELLGVSRSTDGENKNSDSAVLSSSTEVSEAKVLHKDSSWEVIDSEESSDQNLQQTPSEQVQLGQQDEPRDSQVSNKVSTDWENRPPRILRRQAQENTQETKDSGASIQKSVEEEPQNEVYVHIADNDQKGFNRESPEIQIHRPIRRNRPNLTSGNGAKTGNVDTDCAGSGGDVPTHAVDSPKRDSSGFGSAAGSPKQDSSLKKGKALPVKEKTKKTASVSVKDAKNVDEVKSASDVLELAARSLPEARLEANSTFRGYVRGEVSGGSFWMQLSRTKEQDENLALIQNAINNIPTYGFKGYEPPANKDQLLFVKTGVSEYKRARIHCQVITPGSTRSQVVVCFIDEGKYEKVATTNIFTFMDKPALEYPQQTVRCTIIEDPDQTLPTEANKLFQEVTSGKLLEAKVMTTREEFAVVELRETGAGSQKGSINSLINSKFPSCQRKTRTPPSSSRTPTPPDMLQGRPVMTYSQPAMMTTAEQQGMLPSGQPETFHQQRWGMGVPPQTYYGVPGSAPHVVPGMVPGDGQWVVPPATSTVAMSVPDARAFSAGFSQPPPQPPQGGGGFVIDNWNEGPSKGEPAEKRESRYNRREHERFGDKRDGSRGSPRRDGFGSYRGHRDRESGFARDRQKGACHNCNEIGHFARDCPKPKPPKPRGAVRRDRNERGGRRVDRSSRYQGMTSESSQPPPPEPEEEVW